MNSSASVSRRGWESRAVGAKNGRTARQATLRFEQYGPCTASPLCLQQEVRTDQYKISDMTVAHTTEYAGFRKGTVLNIFSDTCKEVGKNIAMSIPAVRRWRLTKARAGAVLEDRDSGLERYAFQSVRILLGILGDFENLRILEIGPGDNLTSGLSLLAAGAASYSVIERFAPDYSRPDAKNWYRAIQHAWSTKFPNLPWPAYLNSEDFPERYPDRVQILPVAIEQAGVSEQFDIICSFQVLEHVTDIAAFAEQNARMLAPNGIAIHRVDFGPHDCWGSYQDPFIFLRFPDWLWTLTGSQRGIPNRRRYHECNAALEAAGFEYSVLGRETIPRNQVNHSRLARQFQCMPIESLETVTAIYVCRLKSGRKGAHTS